MLCAAIAARAVLPISITRYVNAVLEDLPHYRGSIEDIDLALFRGAYEIHGMQLLRINGDSGIPFLNVERSDISIDWRALFNGEIVSSVLLVAPRLRYVIEDHDPEREPEESDIVEFVTGLIPVDINRLAIRNGSAELIKLNAEPEVNLHLKNITLEAANISNVVSTQRSLDTTAILSATSPGGGELKIRGRADLLKKTPEVDMSLSLENDRLPAWNTFSHHYAGVNFEKGSISLYGELAAANGTMVGYVKPILSGLEFSDRDDSLAEALWESLVGFAAYLLENKSNDTIATKVPFEGTFDAIDAQTLTGALNVIRNAWIEAFKRTVDDEISYEDAKNASES